MYRLLKNLKVIYIEFIEHGLHTFFPALKINLPTEQELITSRTCYAT